MIVCSRLCEDGVSCVLRTLSVVTSNNEWCGHIEALGQHVFIWSGEGAFP